MRTLRARNCLRLNSLESFISGMAISSRKICENSGCSDACADCSV